MPNCEGRGQVVTRGLRITGRGSTCGEPVEPFPHAPPFGIALHSSGNQLLLDYTDTQTFHHGITDGISAKKDTASWHVHAWHFALIPKVGTTHPSLGDRAEDRALLLL